RSGYATFASVTRLAAASLAPLQTSEHLGRYPNISSRICYFVYFLISRVLFVKFERLVAWKLISFFFLIPAML
ncbi:hypothetical protein, partial [Leptospira venezuelensis]|uniref:hypothetical protein n=1 Tax=Leptospira venezuelensis TaxID=1958811 RepID=UPI00197BC7FC